MRWEQQVLDAQDDAALPGLGRRRGVLRTVSPREMPGVRFHEVVARSALNAVPAASRMPFRWTVNPYRGCAHACVYCLDGETPILMADLSTRRLADIAVGDRIVGTVMRGRYRRWTETTVLAHWQTTKPAVGVTLADGTTLQASPDHRFLTHRGWKHVLGSGSGSGRRPHLTTNDVLVGFGHGVPSAARRVVAIQPLGVDLPMFDITTGTGDFVADGVISHNCYARGSHSWLELDSGEGFDREIVVKVNVAEVLAREVARPSWRREHVALGTNTDPYQRAEGRYALMPGIVRALAGSGTPLSILTKGTLLRRDLPLLASAAREVPLGLGVSLAIHDEALHAALEPGTPSPRARLALVRAIRDAGLPCGVMLAPVLPWLTDSTDHLERALDALEDAGATGVMVLPLHLRPGAREWFFAWLARERPGLVGRYQALYARGANAAPSYRRALAARVAPLLQRHGFAGGEPGIRDPDDREFPAGSLPAGPGVRPSD